MAAMTRLSLTLNPMGISYFYPFFLKPQNRFEPNLAEMFIGWSYTRNLFLVLIRNPTWLPGPIMCFDWSKFKKIFLSETTEPIELWLCRNDHWVVLYYICESFADQKFKMAAMTRLSLTLDPMGISLIHLFFWNHKTDLNQTSQKCSLDGHIQDCCFWRWSEIQHGCQGHNVFWLVEILKIFLL
jgi:hypothetical protein